MRTVELGPSKGEGHRKRLSTGCRVDRQRRKFLAPPTTLQIRPDGEKRRKKRREKEKSKLKIYICVYIYIGKRISKKEKRET